VLTSSKSVLIIGSGIGGLAAALCLSRTGLRCDVIERAAEFKEIGAGIQLGPNVFKMLERLGLTGEIGRYAVFPDSLTMMDSISGEEITRIPLEENFRRHFKYPYALIHRADLHGVLLRKCRENPNIRLHTSCALMQFVDHGDAVVATTADGSTYRAAALIGADGLWSTVRKQILNDGPPTVSGHIAYRAVLPIEEVAEEYRKNEMVLWAGPRNHLVHYPLRGGKLYNLVAVFHSDRHVEDWDACGAPEELQERFAGTCKTVQDLLGKISEWRMWVLCDREPVRKWSKGRVTLLGDSAHPMLQYLAQGAGMAFEDAVVLAEAVEASGDDFAAAFERYNDARYLRTARCQITARIYGAVFHAGGVAREIRNMTRAPRTPEQAYESMRWLYEGI
jgi:2-polyprenyl-6-methoxyphenol hydroxylase-like FAD-dependent oxidoreductase